MLRRKTTLSMSFVFFVVWTVLLGGQGTGSLDAAGVGRDYAVVEVSKNPPYTIVNNSAIQPKIQLPNNTPTAPLPMTCKDVKAVSSRVVVRLSGGLEVLCDTDTDGGGWIVFQRRLSSDVDFYRDWADYKYGFGNIKGNFWLGNEKIHLLTFQRRYQLRVDFIFNGNSYFAAYSTFRILGEAEKYRLQVGGYWGTAGDNLVQHNGRDFSTKDRENDIDPNRNCAVMYYGAWWYAACHHSNLNGKWETKTRGVGLNWWDITGNLNSVTSTEMKIRPLD